MGKLTVPSDWKAVQERGVNPGLVCYVDPNGNIITPVLGIHISGPNCTTAITLEEARQKIGIESIEYDFAEFLDA